MTQFDNISKCIITGLPINVVENAKYFGYRVQYTNGKKLQFTFCKTCFPKIETGLKGMRHIIEGMILNDKINDIEAKVIHWDNEQLNDSTKDNISLKAVIEEGVFPWRPKELFDNLFSVLYKRFVLGIIKESDLKEDRILASSTYFRSTGELLLYFDAMKKEGLFSVQIDEFKRVQGYKITYQGLNYLIKTFEEGYGSTKCFVAMSFQDETKLIREAIRKALDTTGFEPIFIDEKDISSERTINDEIISNLKKCKFCIADFTHHKNGVYFESGFALGQGKPVIYTCEKEEFKKAHFDIKPLQHIIYETPDELQEKLIHKIEAWIK